MKKRRVLVIGGGVFGLSAALELLRRGFAVELCDAGPVPHPSASSTDHSKAVRMDYGSDVFYVDLAVQALEGWRRWNRDHAPALFHETGILMLSTEREMPPDGFEGTSYAMLAARGIPLEPIDPSILARRFPAWRGGPYVSGYFNPIAGWVESGKVVERLALQAVSEGLVLHTDRPCDGLVDQGSRVRGARFGDEVLQADHLLVAAGAWTPWLVPGLERHMWATGQSVLHLRPVDPDLYAGTSFPVWCGDIARTGWYGFPINARGWLKLGNHGPGRPIGRGDSLTVFPDDQRHFARFLATHLPQLRDCEIADRRLCLYCDTWNGDFLIDRAPDRPGLTVAAGGSGHGFKFAPVLGPIIADVLEGRPCPAAQRFTWREPGPPNAEMARQTH